MLDIMDGIRELLEPSATTTVVTDDTGADPFVYEPNHLYVFESGDVRDLAGNSPADIERFSVVAMFVADDAGEEADQTRRREITAALDDKRDAYLAAVRATRTFTDPGPPERVLWAHLQGSADADFVRALEVRGIAIRLTGWRFIET